MTESPSTRRCGPRTHLGPFSAAANGSSDGSGKVSTTCRQDSPSGGPPQLGARAIRRLLPMPVLHYASRFMYLAIMMSEVMSVVVAPRGAVGILGCLVKARGLLLVVCVILIGLPATGGRTGPQTGRVRVLYVGQWPYGGRPQYLLEDPLLQTSIVPYHDFGAQLEQIRRYMNLRYPRTARYMTDHYDMVIYANIQLHAFTDRQIQMVADSVTGQELGYMMTGGHTSFGGTANSYPSWAGTWIDRILPVDVVDGLYLKPYFFPLIVSDPHNDLMASLPWSVIPPFPYSLNAVAVRQSGHLLAEAKVAEKWPVLAYGDFGAGRSLAFMTPFETLDNPNMEEWGFFDDMCANVVYFASRLKLPDDPFMIRDLRRLFRSYHDQRLLLLSMIEFVDSFGVSTNKLEDRLEQAEAIRADSYSAYVAQEFVRSSELMRRALEEMKAGQSMAVQVKDAALFWVFVVEWIAVTGTLMVAGSLVWALMIRRRLYRMVRTTRLLSGCNPEAPFQDREGV